METICLKMEENMLKDMDNVLKNNWYSTRTEFIREAIREKLSEIEREEAIKKLAAMRGAFKPKHKLSKEEEEEKYDRVRQEVFEKTVMKSTLSDKEKEELIKASRESNEKYKSSRF
ncbi:MAG: ribbon-helix-helix domain-containing protein [archaeon]